MLEAQFNLMSSLASGRNIVWREAIAKMFPIDSLFKLISNPDYLLLASSLYSVFFSVYIDRAPLDQITFPVLTRFIGDFDSIEENGPIRRVQKKLRDPAFEFPADTIKPLLKRVVGFFEKSKEDFFKLHDRSKVDAQQLKGKQKIEVDDLPENLLLNLELITKIFSLHLLEVFSSSSYYQPILKTCFDIFDFDKIYPAQFFAIQEIKAGASPNQQKRVYRMRHGKQKAEKRVTVADEEDPSVSLLMGNYFSLKNQVYNIFGESTLDNELNHLKAKHWIVEVFSLAIKLRHNFLLDNYTAWITNLSERYAGKPYSKELEEAIFAECAAKVSTVIPPIYKTGVPQVDQKQSNQSQSFIKYLDSKTPEIYDLPYLILNEPSSTPQKSLLRFEPITHSFIAAIQTCDDDRLSSKLISLLFEFFSQRKQFIDNLKKSHLVSAHSEHNLYKKILEFNYELEESLNQVKVDSCDQLWGLVQLVDQEVEELLAFLEKLPSQIFPEETVKYSRCPSVT